MNDRISRNLFRSMAIASILTLGMPAATHAQALETPAGTFSIDSIFGTGFEDHTALQWIRRNADHLSGLTIALAPTIVTVVGTQLKFVQVPPGDGGVDYPDYSGLRVFGQPAGTSLSVGDCVTLIGTVGVFQGGAQLVPAIANFESPSDCATSSIPPLLIPSVASIATDADTATPGDQPGIDAAAMQGIVVTLFNMHATSGTFNGTFQIESQTSPGPFILVGSTLFTHMGVVGENFSVITGVLDIRGSPSRVVLLPRSAADILSQ